MYSPAFEPSLLSLRSRAVRPVKCSRLLAMCNADRSDRSFFERLIFPENRLFSKALASLLTSSSVNFSCFSPLYFSFLNGLPILLEVVKGWIRLV